MALHASRKACARINYRLQGLAQQQTSAVLSSGFVAEYARGLMNRSDRAKRNSR
jgi:hypothetical protein